MSNLELLQNSVTETLGRLRNKNAFLHQQRKFYLNVRARILELNTREAGDGDCEDSEERVIETGLEFSDIVISTKRRVFVSIGYEYFVEKSVEEAVQFAEDKLQLISEAIENFDAKIKEADLTRGRLEEVASHGDAWDEQQDDEDGLPAMEIREELDEEGNVISSCVTPSANEQTRKQLEQKFLGHLQEDTNEKNDSLSDFEKNLKGKLLQKEYATPVEVQPTVDQAETEPETHPFPQIDRENMYTFEELVRKMDEQDELEDEMAEDEYLQSQEDEDDNDDDDDDSDEMNFSIIPGIAAQCAFDKEIRRLRRSKMAPPKSILKKKSKKGKPKKSVGFADAADVHEVENLKEENKDNTHSPQLQLSEEGSVLTKQEFDADLFAKLIGAQGPNEVHERYKDEVEREQEQEQIKSSRKRVSRFKQERSAAPSDMNEAVRSSTVSRAQTEGESTVSEVVERKPDVSEVVEHEPETAVCDTVEEKTETEALMYDIVEKDTEPISSNIVEKNVEFILPDAVEKDPTDKSSTLRKPLRSLQRPRKKTVPSPKIEFLEDTEPLPEPTAAQPSHPSEDSSHFPPEIQRAAQGPTQAIFNPKVDYQSLGKDLDDMARAYALGVYDDDIHEDPGTLVEKLDDFKHYNNEVEQLKEEIKDFQINNPMEQTEEEEDVSEDDPSLMTDVVEKNFPPDYDEDEHEDLSLHPDRLRESVALDYRRLKETLMQNRFGSYRPKDKELEPIDEWGNPVRESRFRSQRFAPP